MFIENENYPLRITMIEGDFGIVLPIQLEVEDDETITDDDCFVVKIFKEINTEPLLIKNYSNIQNNTIEFNLTKEESSLLNVDEYYYDLDWYQNNTFLCNVIAKQTFIVKEKAGAVNESNDKCT